MFNFDSLWHFSQEFLRKSMQPQTAFFKSTPMTELMSSLEITFFQNNYFWILPNICLTLRSLISKLSMTLGRVVSLDNWTFNFYPFHWIFDYLFRLENQLKLTINLYNLSTKFTKESVTLIKCHIKPDFINLGIGTVIVYLISNTALQTSPIDQTSLASSPSSL